MMLTNQINKLQAKLMSLSRKLQDLTSYGMNISGGVVGPEAFMNTPASIFGRQNAFVNNNVGMSMMTAMQMTQLFKQNFMAQNEATGGQYAAMINPVNPQAALPPDAYLFNSFFRSALESGARKEQDNIKRIEMNIQNEKMAVETNLKTATAELEQVEKAEEKGIKDSAPKYA